MINIQNAARFIFFASNQSKLNNSILKKNYALLFIIVKLSLFSKTRLEYEFNSYYKK